MLESKMLTSAQGNRCVRGAGTGGRGRKTGIKGIKEACMNPKDRLQDLFIQAKEAMNRGDHQTAEGLYWRVIGMLRFDEQLSSSVDLQIYVLEELAKACEARGKRDDAKLARLQMQSLRTEALSFA
jgi:hypothetical protein